MVITVTIYKDGFVRSEEYTNLKIACRYADSQISRYAHRDFLRRTYQTARLCFLRGLVDVFYFGSDCLTIMITKYESDRQAETANEIEVANA